jgi:hypothetical protein
MDPAPSAEQLAAMHSEGDAFIRATGVDKVKSVPTVSLGREQNAGRYDVRCAVCGGSPPMPPKGRGAQPSDFVTRNGALVYIHEGCLGR